MQINEITAEKLFSDPQFPELIEEYAQECALAGLPPPFPHRGIYNALERVGALTTLAALRDGKLVGFMALLISMNPHYSQLIATSESLFVAKAHRSSGAGAKLLKTAEKLSRERGAVGFLVSAPFGGPLATVLQNSRDWEYTNCVFLKVL